MDFVLPYPLTYAIELTTQCNNNCPDCANRWSVSKNQVMDNWKDLFDIIAPVNNRKTYAQLFHITGGEPTLHPDFYEIIKYIDSFGVDHVLFTNGNWTHLEISELMKVYASCDNFYGFLISLHGKDASTHQKFTHQEISVYNETCKTIKELSKNGFTVATNTILTRDTVFQIDEIIELSKKLGARYTVFNRLVGATQELVPDNNDLKNAIIKIERLQEQGYDCRIGNCIPKCFVNNNSHASNAGFERCAISPNGDVRPENLSNLTLGNIFEDSMENIWQSNKIKEFRAMMPDFCHDCIALHQCRAGERAYIIDSKTNYDPLITEPITEQVEKNIELPASATIKPVFLVKNINHNILLTRYNISTEITEEALPIIEELEKQTTLTKINEKFGMEAVNFVGELFEDGYVSFE